MVPARFPAHFKGGFQAAPPLPLQWRIKNEIYFLVSYNIYYGNVFKQFTARCNLRGAATPAPLPETHGFSVRPRSLRPQFRCKIMLIFNRVWNYFFSAPHLSCLSFSPDFAPRSLSFCSSLTASIFRKSSRICSRTGRPESASTRRLNGSSSP